MDNYFTELNNINVNGHTEKKNNLTYLSWAWAWTEVKKIHPDANYKIYENAEGWFYFTDGKTCWVKTGVTINGIEHIEYLPVMDFKNKSIPVENVTSFDVNKAIQRSLTKACARHGLGLYIYAGEDLPEEDNSESKKFEEDAKKEKASRTKALNSGDPVKKSDKPIKERFENAVDYLCRNKELKNKSVIDSLNVLIEDLKAEGLKDEAGFIQSKIDDIIKINDKIPF